MAMTYSFDAPTDQIPDDSRPLRRRTLIETRRRRFLRRWHGQVYRTAKLDSGLTDRQWFRHCMWDAVSLNCLIFGSLIMAVLWGGQVVQSLPSVK